MTLREYFTTHPKFVSNGKLDVEVTHLTTRDVTSEKRLTFCGVPFNAALWQQLKENRLDDPVPPEVLAELRS